MTFELWMVLASVVLLIAQVTIQASLLTKQLGSEYNASPRDEQKPVTGTAARAKRMLSNYLETYPAFIALALVAVISGGADWLTAVGAGLYIVARIAYVPLYLQGVYYIRSLAYIAALVGMLAMVVGIIV